MKFKFVFFFLMLFSFLTACAKEEEPSINAYVYITPEPSVTYTTPSPDFTPSPSPSPTPLPALKPVTISFGGDVMFETHVRDTYDKHGLDYYVKDLAAVFKKSDISMVNLETSISSIGEKEKDKQFTFRSDPKYLDILTASGINIVSLANNHSLDFGPSALEDTLKHLKDKNIMSVGAGHNMSEASQPIYIDKNDTKIAILSSTRVVPFVSWHAGDNKTGLATTYDPKIINAQIKMARANSDIIVCYIHWGEEGNSFPVEHQRKLAHEYIDNGADIVVGSHSHVLQGLESYKNKLIFYSLGNLIFTDVYKKTAILNITADKNNLLNINVTPMEIINFRPTLITGREKTQLFFNELNAISTGVKIDMDGNVILKK